MNEESVDYTDCISTSEIDEDINDSIFKNPFYEYFSTAAKWQAQQVKQSGSGDSSEYVYVPHYGHVYKYNPGLRHGSGVLIPSVGLYPYGNLHGLGVKNFFRNLFHRARPILRSVGNKVVDITANIVKDTIEGKDLKTAAVKNVVQALPTVLQNTLHQSSLEDETDNSFVPTKVTSIEPKKKSTKRKNIGSIATKARPVKKTKFAALKYMS